MKLDKKDILEIIENAFSYVVVLAMFVYGAAKFSQFDGALETGKTVSEMTGMQLMWAFYGYSKPFTITLGVLEITGSILMLIKKTRVFGCLFVTTILVNVILQDIFYEVNVGALKAAILYQALIFIILWLNKDKLIKSFKAIMSHKSANQPRKILFLKITISIILFVILRILEFYMTTKL